MKTELLQSILKNSMTVKHSHGAYGEHESYDVVSPEKVADNVLKEVMAVIGPYREDMSHRESYQRTMMIAELCKHFGVTYEIKQG